MDWRSRRLHYLGALTIALVVVALLSHQLIILLALGPSAYFVGLSSGSSDVTTTNLLISHLAAVAAGWLAAFVLVQGLDPTTTEPQSLESLRLIGSMFLAMVLTGIVLLQFKTPIATAHVTATVIPLAVFPSPTALGALVLAIGVITALHAVFYEQQNHPGHRPV